MSAQHGPTFQQDNTPISNADCVLTASRPEDRISQPHSSLVKLAHHPQRLAHLSIILSLLEVDTISWMYIQHLRTHESTAATLRLVWPQLYQIPDDIVDQLQDLRLSRDWNKMKDVYIRTIAAGVISRSNPNSYRASGWSARSSSSSTTGTCSTVSWASSSTCQSAYLPTVPEITPSHTTLDTVVDPGSSVTDGPPAPPPKIDDGRHHCPMEGCNMNYKHKAHFENHMMLKHQKNTRAPGEQPRPRTQTNDHPAATPVQNIVPRRYEDTPIPIERIAVRETRESSFSELIPIPRATMVSWMGYENTTPYTESTDQDMQASDLEMTTSRLLNQVTVHDHNHQGYDTDMSNGAYDMSMHPTS